MQQIVCIISVYLLKKWNLYFLSFTHIMELICYRTKLDQTFSEIYLRSFSLHADSLMTCVRLIITQSELYLVSHEFPHCRKLLQRSRHSRAFSVFITMTLTGFHLHSASKPPNPTDPHHASSEGSQSTHVFWNRLIRRRWFNLFRHDMCLNKGDIKHCRGFRLCPFFSSRDNLSSRQPLPPSVTAKVRKHPRLHHLLCSRAYKGKIKGVSGVLFTSWNCFTNSVMSADPSARFRSAGWTRGTFIGMDSFWFFLLGYKMAFNFY